MVTLPNISVFVFAYKCRTLFHQVAFFLGKVCGTCSNNFIPDKFLGISDIFSSHSPFLLRKRPFEINLQSIFQPSYVWIIEVVLTPSEN